MSIDLIYAKIVADSISPAGHRVTTMEVCLNRFVLAELNTHRVIGGRSADRDANEPGFMEEFSRNSASSRAIPFRKQYEKVMRTPAMPVSWPQEQKGMQGGAEIETPELARRAWREAAQDAARHARNLAGNGVHKSVANRLLEPFLMHTVVLTATNWQGFFEQRCSPLAQSEIKAPAEMMQAEMEASIPTPLAEGEWHLPYIDQGDVALTRAYIVANGDDPEALLTGYLVRMSAARCARVSYETQDGKRDPEADLALYDRLVSARPAHWSPLEHPCTPWAANAETRFLKFTDLDGTPRVREVIRPVVGNLLGFRQHRFEMETA